MIQKNLIKFIKKSSKKNHQKLSKNLINLLKILIDYN
jgi:hypothetical protein